MTTQIDLFHNTIGLLPSEHRQRSRKAGNQTEAVLSYFKAHRGKDFTPAEVLSGMGVKWPITSVRRSITDLTKMGELTKTTTRRMGIYGELNFTWKYETGR